MARAKDVTISQAFQQKSRAAEDKLQRFQVEQLCSDMDRLFTEGLHSDMTLELQYKTLNLHSCILKARSKELYNKLVSLPGSSSELKSVSMTTYTDTQKLEDLFRSLYTEDDITNCLCEFTEIFAMGDNPGSATDYTGEATHSLHELAYVPDRESALEEDIDESNKNGIDECLYMRGQDKLHVMALDIVESAIKSAFEVITKTNGQNTIKEAWPDFNGDSQKHDTNFTNGSEGTKNSDGRGGHSENSETSGMLANIKSTGEECVDSISVLLERVCRFMATPCGRLGEDLLRLWLNETDCDTSIMINSATFPAHKCILSCRSSYFDAMLGGSWRESDQEEIVLEGIDTGTMRQTLLYLYGGVVEVDQSCSLGGLVMMSDMYTMEGLKEVVSFNLNKEYCHFFHRPCPTCTVGVPEALALTMVYNMEAMRDKCVKWINKNFSKVWPTKQFASLPQEVMEFCVSTAVKDLAMDNVIDTMVECRQLNEKTPRLKWSECILDMITRLMDACIEFASQNFVNIVGSKTFRNIDKQGIAFNKQPLEDIFGMVIMALSPENSCQAFMSLDKWMVYVKPKEEVEFRMYTEEFSEFVEFLFKKCREHMCLYIHQVAHTVEWTYLSKECQKDIMEEANYVCIDTPNKSRMARPQLTSMQKKTSATSNLSLKEYFDQHFGLRVADKKSKSPSPARGTASPRKSSSTQKREPVRKTGGQQSGEVKKRGTTLTARGSNTASNSSKVPGTKETVSKVAKTNVSVASGSNTLKSKESASKDKKGTTPGRSQTNTSKPGDTCSTNEKEMPKGRSQTNASKAEDSTYKKEMPKGRSQTNASKSEDSTDKKEMSKGRSHTNERLKGKGNANDCPDIKDKAKGAGSTVNKSKLNKQNNPPTKDATTVVRESGQAGLADVTNYFTDSNPDGVKDTHHSDKINQATSDDLEDPPTEFRQRSMSLGHRAFVPRFGEKHLRSAQSTDSFFDDRQGFNAVIQKPTPTLEVKFIVPHEFHESF